jgi:hypothetical protein
VLPRCPFVSLVALLTWRDLLFCAKHLLVAAMVAIAAAGGSRMSNGNPSDLSSEQGLASIPMAQGAFPAWLSRASKSAGVPVAPLLKACGTDRPGLIQNN